MTQPLPTFLPPTPLGRREPLVVPFAPQRGWAVADGGRRVAALLALPLAAVVCAATATATGPGGELLLQWLLLAWVLLGPATFYSLARVLRPEAVSAERTPRHLLASAATAFAAVVVAARGPAGNGGVVIVFGTTAALLGVTTLVWGVVALAVRIARR